MASLRYSQEGNLPIQGGLHLPCSMIQWRRDMSLRAKRNRMTMCRLHPLQRKRLPSKDQWKKQRLIQTRRISWLSLAFQGLLLTKGEAGAEVHLLTGSLKPLEPVSSPRPRPLYRLLSKSSLQSSPSPEDSRMPLLQSLSLFKLQDSNTKRSSPNFTPLPWMSLWTRPRCLRGFSPRSMRWQKTTSLVKPSLMRGKIWWTTPPLFRRHNNTRLTFWESPSGLISSTSSKIRLIILNTKFPCSSKN